jgi:hypothetical protein
MAAAVWRATGVTSLSAILVLEQTHTSQLLLLDKPNFNYT